ncbi:hypothetical protein A7U60_g5295 [Sanghuangporus baumii]|uniref:Uncharacterized protein n=1 Tax=Sanghuangporus baumii TaxID=108892 RepID=A0A9Q5HX73_SANBA|nr:hypothetical protein A7U60_g5295 [Sanghuangporus baumii]
MQSLLASLSHLSHLSACTCWFLSIFFQNMCADIPMNDLRRSPSSELLVQGKKEEVNNQESGNIGILPNIRENSMLSLHSYSTPRPKGSCDDRETVYSSESDRLSTFKPTNIPTLGSFHGRAKELTDHLESSFITLGGGSIIIIALRFINKGLYRLSDGRIMRQNSLGTWYCIDSMRALRDSAATAQLSFKNLMFHLAEKYGSSRDSLERLEIDKELDAMFERLIKVLETYVKSLESISEKDIPVIRQYQESIIQHHTSLTGIATFLSSVTATTLQISTSDSLSNSPLATIANTFWFISLVFSAASAIYSLLGIIWRRSPISMPEVALSGRQTVLLEKAPMISLMVALMTFSIGLCLLAFVVPREIGGVVPAAVPTVFAVVHVSAILFLTAGYLSTKPPRENILHFQVPDVLKPEHLESLLAAPTDSVRESSPGGSATNLIGTKPSNCPFFTLRHHDLCRFHIRKNNHSYTTMSSSSPSHHSSASSPEHSDKESFGGTTIAEQHVVSFKEEDVLYLNVELCFKDSESCWTCAGPTGGSAKRTWNNVTVFEVFLCVDAHFKYENAKSIAFSPSLGSYSGQDSLRMFSR